MTVREEAAAGPGLPALPASTGYFYGMEGDGAMPGWRAQEEPIRVHGHCSRNHL